MRKAEQMRALLESKIAPLTLRITDESLRHADHVGSHPHGESHFHVEVTARQFEGMSRVARHRLVYEALTPVLDEGLHALRIDTKAPGE